ncbi:hypothetical protein HDE_08108 [Halotydeus destructor]|nr:hypothetical protein HDE_08108 [Halotydeus destructor]
MHRIIVNVFLLCTAAMVKGNNRGRGQSGGGRSYVFIPNTASQQGYSGSSMFMTGLSEFIAGYLAICVVNTVVFTGARKALLTVTPSFLRSFLVESLATIELCADCAELGVVWEVHGNAGYALALFACCMWWAYFWYDAEACPAGPIEDCFLIGAKFTQWSIVSKLIGQAVGAYFTWRYVQWFWKFHLIPQHVTLNTLPCQAGLQCSMVYGALIEALISFISRFVCLESGYLPQLACAAVNSITTVGLCLFAMDSSGGYFNPILASALTLNCKGNNFFEHLFVYWVASLTGGIIARTIHLLMRGATLVPKDKDD